MTQRLARPSRWLLASLLAAGCAAPLPVGLSVRDDGMGPMMMHHMPSGPATALSARLSVDGSPTGVVSPGRAATLSLSFSDPATGASLTRFAMHHEKPLHLVAVSRDLSSFAHLHPAVDATGRFTLRVNAPSADPDNADAERAFMRPGAYFLFAEVTPEGRGTGLARLDLNVPGTAAPEPIATDAQAADGAIVKDLSAGGEAYRARVRFTRSEHHPGMPMLALTVTVQRRTATGAYEDVDDLAPWLGMGGHAMVIGAAGDRAADRTFLHLHAEGAATGPTLSFMAMGADVPPAGLYRTWVQFKHRGRVLTVSATTRL